MIRQCAKCKERKEESEFYVEADGRVSSYCKNCAREKNKLYHKENRESILARQKEYAKTYERAPNPKRDRDYVLRKKYGISDEDYEEMYALREGMCDICGKWFEKLHIDHSHEDGRVRGLLCLSCNTGIGNFKDSIETLNKAIRYLEEK